MRKLQGPVKLLVKVVLNPLLSGSSANFLGIKELSAPV
jgi:hypothetical protein